MRQGLVLTAVGAVISFAAGGLAPSMTETAVANGDTRTLHLYHTHTGESIDATFRVDGRYDQAVLSQLNTFLRDWRNNDQIRMDPRLFDTIWEVYRTAGATDPIQIYSAYRSPETNAMLRRRSRAVAEHSQHMLGKAMDTTMPGMSMERIREIGMRLQRGGVGYYQSANFVHLDVGGVRSWPRMSYEQLARLFPDGKTVHIPANGHPMARYEEARAEIAARGGTDIPPAQESQGFFAWLFGGSNGGAEPSAGRARPVAVAAIESPEGDEGSDAVATQPRQAAAVPAQAPIQAQAPVQAQAQAESPAPAEAAPKLAAAALPPAIELASDTRLPLPPRRPVEFAALAVDLPIPPTRPDDAFRLRLASVAPLPTPVARPVVAVPDAIGGLIAAAKPAQQARAGALPAIITGGRDRRVPAAALGFAALETTGTARATAPAAQATAKPVALRSMVGLRGADKAGVKTAAVPAVGPAPLGGPSIVGLRRAARAMAVETAL